MTDYGKEWTNEECAQFVRDNADDLSGFVKLLRGEAVLKNDNGQTFIIDKTLEEGDPDKPDASCVGAVLMTISKITGKAGVSINETTLYKLSQFLRIEMTLRKFADMGLLEKDDYGYRPKTAFFEKCQPETADDFVTANRKGNDE